MVHPRVEQMRFARREFVRSFNGVTPEEGLQRFGPINSISWIVGHLASQEQRYWFERRGEPLLVEGLRKLVGTGEPASTPPLDEMWDAWRTITGAADPYLDSLTSEDLEQHYVLRGKRAPESVGTLILRVTYHYWYHNGEGQAIRQMLGHTNLPQFVGDIGGEAPYRPE